ncbi:tRNA lysidine(34) synthetase TilS [uncultured Xylophilus sp.]|uniref:tRNA lysidine(34) synthetase TilS n=1 Tax=uncultured Xylophilus sp. TaxID=296832 RepID=UPI0025FA6596|nr:tRNA lysidine(34) synthetase TilS [uncultured Xylophilus sp.]
MPHPVDPVDRAIAAFSPALPLAVAFSGGADSTALLAACAARWPGQVQAVHVHHGLQAAADRFVARCEQTCAMLGVPLQVLHVDARAQPGASPEDAARRARYDAFDRFAQEQPAHPAIKSIALAQHADDQVETVLLALSRGGGIAGLAGMRRHWQRDGIDYHRPLIDVPGNRVRAWAEARGLHWIEDPSNVDTRFTRNRIRAQVLPALAAALPQFRATFARSARHAAEAQAVLDEVAAADLAHVGSPPILQALQRLSAPRQAMVVRRWLREAHGTTPDTVQLAELQRQIAACTTRGHRIAIKVGVGMVHREGDRLGWYNPAVLASPPAQEDPAPQNDGPVAPRA